MKAYEYLDKTREYLDYLQRHITNVENAYHAVCKAIEDTKLGENEKFMKALAMSVNIHDLSKFSEKEFVQYRKNFYPIDETEKKDSFEPAWQNHKDCNPHHWETWKDLESKFEQQVECVHMIIDWTAMGYEFGDTAHDYWNKNRGSIEKELPDWAGPFIDKITKKVKKHHIKSGQELFERKAEFSEKTGIQSLIASLGESFEMFCVDTFDKFHSYFENRSDVEFRVTMSEGNIHISCIGVKLEEYMSYKKVLEEVREFIRGNEKYSYFIRCEIDVFNDL